MNDNEFFELLNLYLDHEISTADAARLEAEVQNNRARRSIYQDYCRMQKACRMIAADFQTDPAETVAPSERKVIAFNPAAAKALASRRKRMVTLYSVGSFAALAACVAVIFVGRGERPVPAEPAGTTIAPVAVAPASAITNPDATFVASKSAAPRGLVSLAPKPQPIMKGNTLLLHSHAQAGSDLDEMNQPNDQLAWIPATQVAPLQQRAPADLNFTATYGSGSRALGSRTVAPVKTSQPGDEYLGFQFVK